MKTKQMPVRIKAGPDDGLLEGEFIVYPSTFIKEPDSYGDIVAPGAFADTIAEWTASGLTMPALYGHRMDDPDFFVGGAVGADMAEDEIGWRVKGAFDLESPKGPQTYRLAKSGRLAQLSFAYDVLEEGAVQLDDGRKVNELRKLKVYEFSFVPIGANQDTSIVAIKAMAEDFASAAKAGRVLSAKNEETLRGAIESLDSTRSALKNVLSQIEAGDDQEKASGQAVTNDEEPQRAKSEESGVSPSARALAVNQYIQTL
ncbi:HK97 family phage prohead protease [Herbiconiux solani]|uniref:HK97 family phage prohead protease n=1 Tax=Herbiconiux solani TaxID=661329 RepID=UPI0008256A25|nr:HK97 family phage prohead protease [Herbiconiux solani]